jgi:hypothetical protein
MPMPVIGFSGRNGGHDLHHRLAQDRAQALLEAAHPGLACIAVDHAAQCRIADPDLAASHAHALELLRPQVVARDGQLLGGDVAAQADGLHAVEQWPGDGVELVRGTHEQHLRQVEADVEVMVKKLAVLLRIEHLEQGRGGVALVGRTDLVDLVEHDQRVLDLDFLDRLDELAGHGADVGPTVPLDLGLVAHAAEAEAVELASQCVGDRAADRGFADPGRAHQQQDRPGDGLLQRADGEELDDAVLDVLEAVVVAVEDAPRLAEIELVLGMDAPG